MIPFCPHNCDFPITLMEHYIHSSRLWGILSAQHNRLGYGSSVSSGVCTLLAQSHQMASRDRQSFNNSALREQTSVSTVKTMGNNCYMSPPKVDTTKMRVVMPMEEISERVACHSLPHLHALSALQPCSQSPSTHPPLPNTLQMCVCVCACIHFSVCIPPTPASSTQSTQTEVARDRLLCSPLSDAAPCKC